MSRRAARVVPYLPLWHASSCHILAAMQQTACCEASRVRGLLAEGQASTNFKHRFKTQNLPDTLDPASCHYMEAPVVALPKLAIIACTGEDRMQRGCWGIGDLRGQL